MTSTTVGSPVAFKRLANPSLGKMLQPERSTATPLQVPYLKAGHVQWGGVDLPEGLPLMWASAADIRDLKPEPGDLLICEGGEVGRAALAPSGLPENTIIQNSLHLVRETGKACPRYLKYALEHVAASGWIDLVCNKATIAHLTVDKLRELPVPFWCKRDQERIANFLDDKTARIDALIGEEEKLTARLDELRYSTVSWAVTGGLHRLQGTIKTGHSFIPTVPSGWKLGGLTKYIGPVVDYRGKTPEKVDEGVLLVTARNIRDGLLDYSASAEYVREDAYEEIMRRGRPEIGDVLFTTEAPLGQVANVDRSDIALAQRIVKFRGLPTDLNNYFLKYWLMGDAVQSTLATLATGSTAEGIKASKLGQIPIAIPSLKEQGEIVKFLDERRGAFDAVNMHARSHVALLREYRSSLISAAVTGQLDLANV